jgi:hypothetical protein
VVAEMQSEVIFYQKKMALQESQLDLGKEVQ